MNSVVSTDQPSRLLVEGRFRPVMVETDLDIPNRFRRFDLVYLAGRKFPLNLSR